MRSLNLHSSSIFITIVLSSCAMSDITDDMHNNAFLNKAAINNNIDGIWTGAIGPGLNTYIIENNGNGVSCYYHRGDAIIYKQKIFSFENNKYRMISEDGTISTISKDSGSLILQSYGYAHKLKSDPQLDLANTACKETLKKLH